VKLVVADVGGTHVRYALAEVSSGGPPDVGPTYRYRTREHPDLASTWRHLGADVGGPLPDAASLALAAPFGPSILSFPNSGWTLDTRTIARDLGLAKCHLLNDFGAVAHAVPSFGPEDFIPVIGADGPLPETGAISVIGPGTGLGAAILRRQHGRDDVVETEAGHAAFAPHDAEEAAIAEQLRRKWPRLSAERIVAGPGLDNVAWAFAALEGQSSDAMDSSALWAAAIERSDERATRALDVWLLAFASSIGDIALSHGSRSVVLVGSLVNRIAERLREPTFADRFRAKGRYRDLMEHIPVKLLTREDPGLVGAALAFQKANDL